MSEHDRRRGWLLVVFAALLPLALALDRDAVDTYWATVWSTAVQPADTGAGYVAQPLRHETLRQFVRLPIAGTALRIRFSNAEAPQTVNIARATVALRSGHWSAEPGTMRSLTFGGRQDVDIAPGAMVVTDPVPVNLAAGAELAISIYVPEGVGPPTLHLNALQASYASGPTDVSEALSFPSDAKQLASWYWLSGVDMRVHERVRVLVVIGDSIADGVGSTPDRNRRLVDQLNERLAARPGSDARLIAVNAGIAGNRLLNDVIGRSLLARFDRDVLQVGGEFAMVSIGTVDIAFSEGADDPADIVTAGRLIDGFEQLARHANSAGVRLIAATLTPSKGANSYSPEGEAIRQAVNDWIRTSPLFYSVVDFDQILRDPDEPARLRADYNSGDDIHPNDLGYKLMADAASMAIPR